MKYYYNCPIIAAYMAKYQRIDFGMNIHTIFNLLCATNAGDIVPVKYYLDEKNLAELKPQREDILEFWYNCDKGRIKSVANSDDLPRNISFEEWEIIKNSSGHQPVKILSRNNKPFFMPESEE